MKIIYDIPYFKEIVKYVLFPVIIVLIITGLVLYIYSKKNKDHTDRHYNFVMNFWSCLIGIIVTSVILAMAVAFSLAITERMVEYNLVEEKKVIYYVLKYFIVIPAIFVLIYIIKLIKTIVLNSRYKKENSIDDKKVEKKAEPVEEIKEVKEEKNNTDTLAKPKKDDEIEIITLGDE